MFRLSTTITILGLLATGCGAPLEEGPVGSGEGFGQDFFNVADEFGVPGGPTKDDADWGGLPSPCEVLAPLSEFGDQALRSAFVLGVEGDGVLGVVGVFGGFDVVMDVYHRQITVSKYSGAGIATPQLASTVAEGYAGFALGFQHGVADWDGHFVTLQGEISLPFIREYISLKPSFFVTAVDHDHDGAVSYGDAVMPPAGVYGFTIGVALGFSILPTGLPVEASLTVGHWEPYNNAIRAIYDQLARTHFFRLGSALEVSLVDHHTGAPCDPAWPQVGGHQECVIQVGRPDWSNSRSARHMAYAVCTIAGGCAVPLAWPASGAALANGVLQDAGAGISDYCGFSPGQAPAQH